MQNVFFCVNKKEKKIQALITVLFHFFCALCSRFFYFQTKKKKNVFFFSSSSCWLEYKICIPWIPDIFFLFFFCCCFLCASSSWNLTSKMRCHQCHLPVQVSSDYFAVAIFSLFCKNHQSTSDFCCCCCHYCLFCFSKEGKKWEEYVISLMYWNTFMLWLAHSWFIIFCNFSPLLSLSFL